MNVQAAAERLRRIHNGEPHDAVYGPELTLDLDDRNDPYVCDMRLAVGTFLAEHDETPVDEAWLLAVKFGETLKDHRLGMGRVLGFISLSEMKTRGQVRRLASALGIELREPQA